LRSGPKVAQTFFDSKGIGYLTARSVLQLSPADVGEMARLFTVHIECKTIRKSPEDEGKTTPELAQDGVRSEYGIDAAQQQSSELLKEARALK
jgi:hypothetical protein